MCERGFAIRQGRVPAVVLVLLGVALASAATPARAGTADVTIANRAFSPPTVTVEAVAGEPELPDLHAHVNFVQSDQGLEHTVTFDDQNFVVESSGRLSPGQVYKFVLTHTGTFTYRCEIHPEMTGTVVVTAASTDARIAGHEGSGATVAIVIVVGAVIVALAVATSLVVRRRWSGHRDATNKVKR
jgi:plastocyanin